MGKFKELAAAAAALAAPSLLAACEPVPPRPVLVVDSYVNGDDASPGDGVCETAPGNGTCPLRAAVQEANALGRAAIELPAGEHQDGSGTPLPVSGDLLITGPGVTASVDLGAVIVRVEEGALLHLTDVAFADEHPSIDVGGLFVGQRLHLVGADLSPVDVDVTGAAFLDQSVIASTPAPPIRNHGRLILRHSYLLGASLPPELGGGAAGAIETGPVGSSFVAGSVLHTEGLQACFGPAPASGGHNVAVESHPVLDSCQLHQPGDLRNVPLGITYLGPGSVTPFAYSLAAGSSLVDAIPAGVGACAAGGADFFGSPRPVDGDGDGEAACDIGPVERPAG